MECYDIDSDKKQKFGKAEGLPANADGKIFAGLQKGVLRELTTGAKYAMIIHDAVEIGKGQ